jgi:HK97 family phage prohead protease
MGKKTTAIPIEYKLVLGAAKATNDALGTIEGYLNTTGLIDYGKDRSMPGSFKRTIAHAYDRKAAHEYDFLWPYLWNHDYDQIPPGGIYEAEEDSKGLFVKIRLNLDYELGHNMYTSFKAGTLKKQRMGFRAHKYEYVREEGGLVRNLIETEVVEGSGVVFPMNNEAEVTHVKSLFPAAWPMLLSTEVDDASLLKIWTFPSTALTLSHQTGHGEMTGEDAPEQKATVCGNTSGPIGPRDESWDGSKAKSQIFSAAEKEGGSLDAALCRKYFMVLDGDPQLKGSWGYPFWYVGESPHICVGAVKAIAGLVQGARGGSAPDGVKGKVETLYRRINAKYPDDTELVPPWKRASSEASGVTVELKDFTTIYAQLQAKDALADWYDLLDALGGAMIASMTGPGPADAFSASLSQFVKAAMGWSDASIQAGLPDLLTESLASSPLSPAQGDGEDDGWWDLDARTPEMEALRLLRLARKAGRTFSGANEKAMAAHADGLTSLASKHLTGAKDHAHQLTDTAQGIRDLLSTGSAPSGKQPSDTNRSDGKSHTPALHALVPPIEAHKDAASSPSPEDTADPVISFEELEHALSSVRQSKQATTSKGGEE